MKASEAIRDDGITILGQQARSVSLVGIPLAKRSLLTQDKTLLDGGRVVDPDKDPVAKPGLVAKRTLLGTTFQAAHAFFTARIDDAILEQNARKSWVVEKGEPSAGVDALTLLQALVVGEGGGETKGVTMA